MSFETSNTFRGRSLTAAGDWSVDEQRYLYDQTRKLKHAWHHGSESDLDPFRIQAPKELSVWLMFLEASTRTKESFRNAANFHNATLNTFDAATSSIGKKSESLVDTVKMLYGYSKRSIFIIRSKMEGVCLALSEQLGDYAGRLGRERPVFLNAGDGRHEHPTQEFLDEFTFLEQLNWDTKKIHVALIGDLLHGRTVHSKADGLKIFDQVIVDLVAPPELNMPTNYVTRMQENGFTIRTFTSIQDYLEKNAKEELSPIWYFTRLQLERMGDEIRDREAELRQAVTFYNPAWMEDLPDGCKFYHPLPRHRERPVIPNFLDQTPLNGWDGQSGNGYFTRIMELALVAGHVGDDFKGQVGQNAIAKVQRSHSLDLGSAVDTLNVAKDYIKEIPVTRKTRVEDQWKVGIKPVDDGTVIDHIAKGKSQKEIWDRIDRIRRLLKLNVRGSHGVFHSNVTVKDGDKDTHKKQKIFKGIMSLPDVQEITPTQLKKLAAASPGCTVNVIANQSVQKKYRLDMPPRIYNFEDISCANPDCVTAKAAYQNVSPYFYRTTGDTFTCRYCGRRHEYGDIWLMA
mmetsp:Transcript_9423/g.26043  ORF Transcript_9423/g.26043 Transcript_9423/m.26043 type:complete len:570 (-) Transcript_9423:56-1765(-)